MQWYKVILTMGSPSGTLWQADTIFGHLCWRLRHNKGDKTLSNFLEWFVAGQPALLLSDGFPDELLPKPLLFALPRLERIAAFDQAKEIKKQVFLSQKDFARAIHGDLFTPEKQDEKIDGTLHIDVKNQINRATGTTGGEGQLYSFASHWIRTISIYLKIEKGFETLVEELFVALKDTGYGKRKSVGYGAIESVRMETFPGFPCQTNPNAFVSLSSFVPAEGDPINGRWGLRVKLGKLGEELAASDDPFKRPLIMLTPGSAFYDSPVKEYYGRLVGEVSPAHPEVVQYGFALPVPMLVSGDV